MFGDRLKELRIKKNIKQEELAEIINVTRATISNWENNKGYADGDILIKLAEYFNVTTDYLLGFNKNNLNELDKLKIALKEAGIMKNDDDLTKEELEKALKIVEMMKETKDTK